MAITYTVMFAANGGAVPSPLTVVLPENTMAYGTLATTAYAGHVFLGWFTAEAGGTLVEASTGPVPNMDHTLYAHWATAVTVVFAALGGSAPDPSATVIYGFPCAYGTLPVTALSGYHFGGWCNIDGQQVYAGDAVPSYNHTLYARWYVTVTFDGNGGTGLSDTSVNYTMPDTYGALPGATRAGYVKTGWWTAANGGTRVISTTDVAVGDHTLYAQWAEAPVVAPSPGFEVTADGEWVYFTVDVIAGNLPGDLQTGYNAWLTAADRKARLAQWVNGILQDFRSAVDAESDSVGGTDVTLLPLPCQRHAQMMIWYFLGLEIGYADAVGLRQGWQEAEVVLRSLFAARRLGENRFTDDGGGTPRYGVRTAGGARSADSGLNRAGVISYGI